MSRGVKDLRALINVSRLESVPREDKVDYIQPSVVGDLDKWNCLLDENSLKDILERSNKDLNWICDWCQDHNARVYFMNWWLTGLSDGDRRDLFSLEYEIICAEMVLIIKRGCKNEDEAEKVSRNLLITVFWEYPHKIFSNTGPHLFLDYLDSLVSEDCKHLLSAIIINTQDQRTIRYCLSLRAFTIVSLWSALIRFHTQLICSSALSVSPLHSHCSHIQDSLSAQLSIVLSHNFFEVLNFWLKKKKMNLVTFRDHDGRNLVTLAVSFRSLLVVNFLLDNYDVSDIINTRSKAGNSALHLAVIQGSLELTKTLVIKGHADIDVINPDCDNCTPLHMAIIYGQEDIAKFLIDQGANSDVKTSRNVSTVDMTAVFEETEVTDLISHMRLNANEPENCLS